MPRQTFAATLAVAALAIGGTGLALAQAAHQHGGHRAAPATAAPAQTTPAQTPPTAEQVQGVVQMMGRMTPEQMSQVYAAMRQRMTPEQHAGMMARMGHGGHGAAPAQPGSGAHDHGAAAPAGAPASPSTAAFLAANEKMHRDMAIAFTGDADRDFAAAMIPHHQGAIEMARIQIQHGRDPGMRRLAEAVIREQEREIAELREFLARRPGR
jgi:uncharacterized protein (DUF305 family)